MEKLELKHLSPYLPYGLKCLNQNLPDEEFVVEELIGISDHIMWSGRFSAKHGSNHIPVSAIKPTLRPLSDLTFEDLDKLGKRYDIQVNNEEVHVFRDLDENTNPLEWRYEDVQYLLSRHFDVFGLIEKGLAIDINTLN